MPQPFTASPSRLLPARYTDCGHDDCEVQALPEIYRSVFVLCCLGDLTVKETARQLRIEEGTVASRLARAKQLLWQRLAKRGVSLSVLLAALDVAHDGLEVTAARAVASAALLPAKP